MLNWLLAAGLVLSVATQLRLGGFPIGVGEVLLLLWACAVWVQNLRHGLPIAPPYVRPFPYFFAALLLILSAANLYQVVRTDTLETYALHDTVAYAFLVFIGMTFCFSRTAVNHVRVLEHFVSLGVWINGILFAISLAALTIGPFTISTGFRFVGLSTNPNQLGQLLSVLPFLCVYLILSSRSVLRGSYYLLLAATSIAVGIATGSDAVTVAWLVATGLLVVTAALSPLYVYVAGRSTTLHGLLVTLHLLLICLAGILVTMTSSQMSALVGEVIADIQSGDEGDSRLVLWQGALDNIAKSPVIGLGGGRQVVSPYLLGAREAHNSYLDFTLATGLLGLGCFLFLLAKVVFRSGLLQQPLLLGALTSLLLFSFFHYTFRHPMFWFSFMLVSAVATTHRVSADAAGRFAPAPAPKSPWAETRLDLVGLRKPDGLLVKRARR